MDTVFFKYFVEMLGETETEHQSQSIGDCTVGGFANNLGKWVKTIGLTTLDTYT